MTVQQVANLDSRHVLFRLLIVVIGKHLQRDHKGQENSECQAGQSAGKNIFDPSYVSAEHSGQITIAKDVVDIGCASDALVPKTLAFYISSEVRMPGFLMMMITDTAFISIATSRMTFFNPLLIRQLTKAKERGCLISCIDSLPSREDAEKICTTSRHPSFLAHEIMTMPFITLDQKGLKTPDSLLEIPEPNSHPVLISKHMLLLASFLQHLHPDLHMEIKGLSESPQAIMERLADLATGPDATNHELLGSTEGVISRVCIRRISEVSDEAG